MNGEYLKNIETNNSILPSFPSDKRQRKGLLNQTLKKLLISHQLK